MKDLKHIAEAAMWLSVGSAVIATVFLTLSTTSLWFFVIPALVKLALDTKRGDKTNESR